MSPEPYKEKRPWGEFERFTLNETSTVKLITVKPKQAFSLQSHKNRDEFWRIISGDGIIDIDGVKNTIVFGTDYYVPRNTKHRIEAGNESVVLLEISKGEFSEDDILRFEDKYGRAVSN